MNRPAINVAIEALVIGVMNATLIYGINKVDPSSRVPHSPPHRGCPHPRHLRIHWW